jgi:hypothetical protein
MAQTKTQGAGRTRNSSGGSSSRRTSKQRSGRGDSSSARGGNSSSARSKVASARSRSGSTRSSSQSRNGKGTAPGVQLGDIASKAKGPAIAAGAAAAGVAGGMLIAQRRSKPSLLARGGSTMESASKGLLRASENVGKASERVGHLSEEVRRVREGIEAGGKRRSPIEVVLDGLTRRPS